MSYQVLARKWRPKTFAELAGQEHVLQALVNALDGDRLHHAYLFTGTRGVGKTTIARILARALNCETGVTSTPCGQCSACLAINENRFVDLIEVDAASRTKVEDTRELLENIQYRPTAGRYKIYLIDEVHMLSTHSFNALLKTLEEPPEHVKFLLATTDPQKLPVTVLSRCLQFNLKNLTSSLIEQHLTLILEQEKVPAVPAALWHLARAAAGSMRDALSLTDQAIAHGGGKLEEDGVVQMLGTIDQQKLHAILQGIATKNAQMVLDTAASLAEFAPDYPALVRELLVWLHGIAVHQQVPEMASAEGLDNAKLAEYAAQFSPEEVQLSYQMLLMGQKDLALSPDLHLGFEMLLLRLLAFQPARPGEQWRESPAEGKPNAAPPEKPAAKPTPTPATDPEPQPPPAPQNKLPRPKPQPEPKPLPQAKPTASESPEPPPAPPADSTAPTPQNTVSEPAPPPATPNTDKTTAESPPAPQKLADLHPDNWVDLYQHLPLSGLLKPLCGHLILTAVDGTKLQFIFRESTQRKFTPAHQSQLKKIIGEHFGEPIELSIAAGETEQETPAEYGQRRDQQRLIDAEKQIMQSPLAQKLIAEFDARLIPDSVALATE